MKTREEGRQPAATYLVQLLPCHVLLDLGLDLDRLVALALLFPIQKAHRRHLSLAEVLQEGVLLARLVLHLEVLDVPWQCQVLLWALLPMAALLEVVASDVPWQCQSDPPEECPCHLILPVYVALRACWVPSAAAELLLQA